MKDNSKLLGCREGTALTSLDNVLRRGARLAAGRGVGDDAFSVGHANCERPVGRRKRV